MNYPQKKRKCEIRGCCRTPTEWHHVISRNQIQKRGLHKSMYSDPGNLKEYCRFHHGMTTSYLVRKRLLEDEEGRNKAYWESLTREDWCEAC